MACYLGGMPTEVFFQWVALASAAGTAVLYIGRKLNALEEVLKKTADLETKVDQLVVDLAVVCRLVTPEERPSSLPKKGRGRS